MHIVPLSECASTQTFAKEHLKTFPPNEMTCVLATHQSKGYGMRGSPWVSAPGKSFLATYVNFSKSRNALSQLASLAVFRLLVVAGLSPQVKWPNDVLVNKKKIAGCLVEISSDALLFGIGVNLSLDEELARIDQPATSIAKEGGSPSCFTAEALGQELDELLKTGFSQDEYQQAMGVAQGDTIPVRIDGTIVSVTFDELRSDGTLSVLDESGKSLLLVR